MPYRFLEKLFSEFQQHPKEFFHEKELHAHFYSVAREGLGTVTTQDGVEVHRLRYEYDSIWRYVGNDDYALRHASHGITCNLDFAILRDDFVEAHSHLAVVNKYEPVRANIRQQAEAQQFSPAIKYGFEFKMSFMTRGQEIGPNEINVPGILKDCRKLAQERVEHGFILVFSHGRNPYQPQAQRIISECHGAFEELHPDGKLTVYVVTPTDVFQSQVVAPSEPPEPPRPEPPPRAELPPEPNQPGLREIRRRQHDDQLVVVVNAGGNNSRYRLLGEDNTVDPISESYKMPNNQLALTELPDYDGAVQPEAGGAYRHGRNEVLIYRGGPEQSRVYQVGDPEKRYLVLNHELSRADPQAQ